jgi:hypothetical protein
MAKPIRKFRAGTVTCSLWENEILIDGESRTVVKATLERRYKDHSGDWKSSNSYSRNEVPLAIYALQKAFEAMLEKQPEDGIAAEVEEAPRQSAQLAVPAGHGGPASQCPCRGPSSQ